MPDRSRIVLPVVAAALAAAWLLPITTAWKNGADLGHAWAVPVLMGYLWWERWEERPPATRCGRTGPIGWVLAGLFALALLPVRLLLTPFPLWPMLVGVYTAACVGLALTAAWSIGGRSAVRWIGSPLILLVSAMPVPSAVESTLIIPLREAMAATAAEICNWFGYPALAAGTSIRLASGWVGVDEACGGIRSLQACVMIGLFFGEWFRFPLSRRILLVLASTGAAIAGNFGRVVFLSLRAGNGLGAAESAHDLAGWIAMALSLVLTGWIACCWAGYRWPEQKRIKCEPRIHEAAPAWFLVVASLLALNEFSTRLWFARGEAAESRLPQWTAELPVARAGFQPQPLAETAREMLRPDRFLAGRWRAGRDESVAAYYIEWRQGQVARSVPFLHNPTVCMPLAGCELVATLGTMRVPVGSLELPFSLYRFRRAGEEMLVAFTIWDPTRGRPLDHYDDIHSWSDWVRLQWKEVQEARKNQPAQLLTISISGPKSSPVMLKELISEIVVRL